MCLGTQLETHPCSELWCDLFTLNELDCGTNGTGGGDAWYVIYNLELFIGEFNTLLG